MSIVYFLALIGVLVTIHEFGHFVVAKLLDFQVTTFSLGFGRPLVRLRLGETEYRVGLFPLGGYVRISGEDPDDPTRSPRGFGAKPMWQRLAVVFAGPAANLLLPVFIYFVFFAGHTELPAAMVGDILPGGVAQEAGLEAGDRIVAIGGDSVSYFEEIEAAVQTSPGQELKLRVSRGGREFDKYITPIDTTFRARDGTAVTHGSIGITWAPFLPRVGVIDPSSPAGRAGIETGDLVVSIDGREIHNWSQLEDVFQGRARRRNLAVFRGRRVAGAEVLEPILTSIVPEVRVRARGEREIYTGFAPAEMFVSRVEPGSPADLAGLRAGDLITALDGEAVGQWMRLDQKLQAHPDKTFELTWMRRSKSGEVIELSARLRQVEQVRTDEYGTPQPMLVFGAHSRSQRGVSEMAPIDGRVSYAVSRAVERTGETIAVLGKGLWAIVRFRAPEAIGGPFAMYRAASVSGQKGWSDFLLMIALISASVGLLNLLPIPGLDGGQVLVFGIESVRRSPLTPRARDRLTVVGLAVVGLITVLAVKNDVVRIILQ